MALITIRGRWSNRGSARDLRTILIDSVPPEVKVPPAAGPKPARSHIHRTTRFSIAWYRQHGYASGRYGDAELLANARGVAVQSLDRDGVLISRAGTVQLIRPASLGAGYDPLGDAHISTWEVLHHLIRILEADGITPAGDLLREALARSDAAIDADLVKELAHLLFRIAEANHATKDALSFNALVTSWPDILDVARAERPRVAQATLLDFEGEMKS